MAFSKRYANYNPHYNAVHDGNDTLHSGFTYAGYKLVSEFVDYLFVKDYFRIKMQEMREDLELLLEELKKWWNALYYVTIVSALSMVCVVGYAARWRVSRRIVCNVICAVAICCLVDVIIFAYALFFGF